MAQEEGGAVATEESPPTPELEAAPGHGATLHHGGEHSHPSPVKYVGIAILLGLITALEVGLYYINMPEGLLVAPAGPVHDVADRHLHSVHMPQHMLTPLVAPPFLLPGPPAWRARELLAPPRLYRVVRRLARPMPALLLFNGLLVVTHWPAFVDATVQSEPLHFLAHAAIFGSALLMWCPVVAPLPELRPLSPPAQMLYLFLQSIVPTVPSAFLIFADSPIYKFYEHVPRLWGLSAGEDQRIAGLLVERAGGALLWMINPVLVFKWHAAERGNGRQARHRRGCRQ